MAAFPFPDIIGLTGFAGTGKDSAAKILHDLYGYEILSMGTEMRAECIRLNPEFHWEGKVWKYADLIQTIGYERTKREVSGVRKFLVSVGHGYRQSKGEDIWLDYVLPRDPAQAAKLGKIVISDVRYQNEVNRIRALGGVVWKLHRPGYYAAVVEEAESMAQIKANIDIQNDGSLATLEAKIRGIMM